jgi:Transcription factor WhiB
MTATMMAGSVGRLRLADFCPPRAELPCMFYDPELWFSEDPSDVRHAKAICLTCPFVTQCARYSLDTNQLYGTWGALSEENRRAIRRGAAARRPGKPCPVCGRKVTGLNIYDRDKCRRSALAKAGKLREAADRRNGLLPGADVAVPLAVEAGSGPVMRAAS